MSGMSHSVGFRMLALMLVSVLMVVVATPARSEALEPTTILAIASLATGGLVLIAYLIVANMEGGDKTAANGQPTRNGRVVWMSCDGDECNEVPASVAAEMGAKLPETALAPTPVRAASEGP
jgi:hypothetical protein